MKRPTQKQLLQIQAERDLLAEVLQALLLSAGITTRTNLDIAGIYYHAQTWIKILEANSPRKISSK